MKLSSLLSALLAAATAPQSVHGILGNLFANATFSPLGCPMTPCKLWSNQTYDLTKPVIIPCGDCITLDVTDGSLLNLPGGLDIRGKLHIPSDSVVTIRTTTIVVQGELAIDRPNNNTVSLDNQNVRVSMFGTTDLEFTPETINTAACVTNGNKCSIGKKSIVVMGGKLSIDGFPVGCSTWTKLNDVVVPVPQTPPTSSKLLSVSSPAGCANTIFSSSFETDTSGWDIGTGSEPSLEAGTNSQYLKNKGRTESWQGPTFDMDSTTKSCLVADTTYIFTSKARLTSNSGNPSQCSLSGTSCLTLKLQYLKADGTTMVHKTLLKSPAAAVVDGLWYTMSGDVSFSASDLDGGILFHSLVLFGPEGGIDISIDEVSLSLPTSTAGGCNDLIRGNNGGADVAGVLYPFVAGMDKKSLLYIQDEGTSDPYFRVTDRLVEWASIQTEIEPGCITEGSLYAFGAKIRIHSSTAKIGRAFLRSYTDATTFTIDLVAECEPSANNWASCAGDYAFTKINDRAIKLEIFFEIENDTTSIVDYDDFSFTFVTAQVTQLVLPADNIGCWGTNSEVVISSSTLEASDWQYAKIIAIDDSGANKIVTLNKAIVKPRTVADAPGSPFAAEVMLLTRNIFIEAEDDDYPNPNHGGHLQILNTPGVAQKIEGVQIRNFGQQGSQGRFPIGFHMSDDASDSNNVRSSISKNTIERSKQRCIVLYDTNNVDVVENVAFNTAGHCYTLDGGSETGNVVKGNIGLFTKNIKSTGLIDDDQSDETAATFYSASPSNDWSNNVAAGSEGSGFWFEFPSAVKGSAAFKHASVIPFEASMGAFAGNVMHSNYEGGLKTYPYGYNPAQKASFQDTNSYANWGYGALLKNVQNVELTGGILADNRMQIDIDSDCASIELSDISVSGLSESYKDYIGKYRVASHCPAFRPLVGIQMHSFLKTKDSSGLKMDFIEISGFDESVSGCVGSTFFDIDPATLNNHFDAYSSFSNVNVLDNSQMISLCDFDNLAAKDVVIEDTSGDFDPSGNSAPGFIVSDNPLLTTFVAPSSACVPIANACALFCASSCFRAVNVGFSLSKDFSDLELEISDGVGTSARFSSYFASMDNYTDTSHYRRRFITAVLPKSENTYNMKLVKPNGVAEWPVFVEDFLDDAPSCTSHLVESSLILDTVQTGPNECQQLIKNGNGEEGSSNHWLHTGGGIQVISPGDKGSSFAISSDGRKAVFEGPAQMLDTRCMIVGEEYEIYAPFQLWNSTSGYIQTCDSTQTDSSKDDICPRATFKMRTLLSDNTVKTTYAFPMASTSAPTIVGYNFMHGSFVVTDEMANADSIMIIFERAAPGLNIELDDVSVSKSTMSCFQPIYNGDFESGNTKFWLPRGPPYSVDLALVNDGSEGAGDHYSLKTIKRDSHWGSMSQGLNIKCLTPGTQYAISANIKLEENDSDYWCDSKKVWGKDAISCPTMTLETVGPSGTSEMDVAWVVGAWKKGMWNLVYGSFTVSEDQAAASSITMFFQKFKKNVNIQLDQVTMMPSANQNCTQLLNNGDLTSGDARNWGSYYGSSVLFVDGGSSKYLAASSRVHELSGVGQMIDKVCLTLEKSFEVSANVRLTKNVNGVDEDFECDPLATHGDTRCPYLSIVASDQTGNPQIHTVGFVETPVWDKTSWNPINGGFNFFENEISAQIIMAVVHGAAKNINIHMGGVSITPK